MNLKKISNAMNNLQLETVKGDLSLRGATASQITKVLLKAETELSKLIVCHNVSAEAITDKASELLTVNNRKPDRWVAYQLFYWVLNKRGKS